MEDRQLFETYKHDIYSFCYYMMQSREDAEDLCQETFVRALLADRSQVREIKAWLIQIAANLCKSTLSRTKKGSNKEKLFSLQYFKTPQHSVEDTIEQRELAAELSSLYGQLPPKIRMAMTLRYINGLKQHEVADIMNLPLGTVKSRINKGLSLMRNRMELKSSLQLKGEKCLE